MKISNYRISVRWEAAKEAFGLAVRLGILLIVPYGLGMGVHDFGLIDVEPSLLPYPILYWGFGAMVISALIFGLSITNHILNIFFEIEKIGGDES